MNIVLVGAGGTWVSNIVFLLRDLGFTNLVCIDTSENKLTKSFKKKWIKTIIWHWNYSIQEEDVVIFSDAAINSIEVVQSNNLKKQSNSHINFSYFEFLGQLSKFFRTIPVTGTHWKTTTTAMTIYLLSNFTNDFALGVVWSAIPEFGNKSYYLNKNMLGITKKIFENIIYKKNQSIDVRKKPYFVVEADEYNNHFLEFYWYLAGITNIDYDHIDFFWNTKNYIKSFESFIKNTEKTLILKKEKNTKSLSNNLPEKVILKNQKKFDFKNIFWEHNQKNASIAYYICKNLLSDVSSSSIKSFLEEFSWVQRRAELLYSEHKKLVYSDYGHHPNELRQVLNSFRKKYTNQKLIAVFQPHQVWRLLNFWEDFVDVLKEFDTVYVYKIYSAREDIFSLVKKYKILNQLENINVENIWRYFSDFINWTYIKDEWELASLLYSLKDGVIVNFTAWDLDYTLRTFFWH